MTATKKTIEASKVFWIHKALGIVGNQFYTKGIDGKADPIHSPMSHLRDAGLGVQIMGDDKLEFFKTNLPSPFIIKCIVHPDQSREWFPMSSTPEKVMTHRPKIEDSKRDGSVLFDPRRIQDQGTFTMNADRQQLLNDAAKVIVDLYESGRLVGDFDEGVEIDTRPFDAIVSAYRDYELEAVRKAVKP